MQKSAALAALALTLALPLTLAACDQAKNRQDTTPAAAGADTPPRPPQPAWAADLLGKNVRELYPKTGDCVGNTEAVETRYRDGAAVIGWGWDKAAKAAVGRVVLVNADFRIVGAGETGTSRPDVPAAVPEINDPNTGWRAIATTASGELDAYGVTDGGQGACKLGHIKF